MDPALAQPYEHLVGMLTAFAVSTRASVPGGPPAERWSRVATHLEQELRRLQSFAASPHPGAEQAAAGHAGLKSIAVRLTQLARTLDGLRLEQTAAAPAEQLLSERRLVVFAAWQLLQTLEHAAAAQPMSAGAR